MEKNLTTGSVGRQLIGFSLPYLLSYLLQTLYGMADLFIIGQYEGVAGTTAVAVGSQVMHMLTVMIVGLAMGTTVSIARAIGADDRPQAAAATGNTVTLFLSLSLVLTAGLLLLRRPITAVMSTPEAAVEGTIRYLTICFLGVPCITTYNILSAIFRGMGDSKSPMIFIFIACLANIALDYLFIGALHLGPAGAALGTSLSQAISVAISLAVIVRRRTMPLAKADLRPQKPVMDAILKIGVPISVQDKFIQISFIVITVIANRRGLTDAAAVGIVEKIIGFLFLVPSSMLSAVSALGAQNLGAGKPERAKQTLFWAIGLACGFGAVTVVAMQFLAEALVGLFTPDQAAVLAGGQYLRGYIWDSFFAGVQFSFSGYFCPCRGSRTFCRTATWAASRRSFASRSRRSPGGSRSSRASSARSTTACVSCTPRRRRSSAPSISCAAPRAASCGCPARSSCTAFSTWSRPSACSSARRRRPWCSSARWAWASRPRGSRPDNLRRMTARFSCSMMRTPSTAT